MLWLIIAIILLIIAIFIEKILAPIPGIEKKINNKENDNIDISKYTTNNYIMTQTELIFYRQLKQITDKLELSIFPQVNLERIIKVSDNNNKDRNKIKSRSIDFSVVNNKNCKIVCCIELDDYSHNRENVKKADTFKDSLFKHVKIPLHRVKVNNYYNLEDIENMIKESL